MILSLRIHNEMNCRKCWTDLSTNLVTYCANTQTLSSFKASSAYKVSPAFAYYVEFTIPEGVWMPSE